MANRKLKKSLKKYDKSKENKQTLISGELGITLNGRRIVEVPGRQGFVYVRLKGNTSELIQAYNATVSPVYDLPVFVVRQTGIYKVVGRNIERHQNQWGTAPFLPKHGGQHSFNHEIGAGGDVVWTYSQQFMPLLSYPSGTQGSMTLSLSPAFYEWEGSFRYAQITGSPDYTPLLPTITGSARMVLSYLDPVDNSIKLVPGTPFSNSITGAAQIAQYIPDIPRSVGLPLAAVRLVTGTTQINWNAVYDVRDFFTVHVSSGSAGGGGGGAADGFGFVGQDEGVYLATGTVLNVTGAGATLSVSGTIFNLSVPGGGGLEQIGIMGWNNGVPLGTGTVLNASGNMDLSISGTVLNISSPVTTYQRVELAIPLNGVTGTAWKVPDNVYASGSLGVFYNGLMQAKSIQYEETFYVSGAYNLLFTPATGSVHMVSYGVPCVAQTFTAAPPLFRIPITIDGSTDGALTDFQVNVKIAHNSDMDSDFGNVYFVDSDGTTEIDFWTEYQFNHEIASFWVKVPSIPASPGTKTIYAYYNGTGSKTSNAEDTFIIGADFDDGTTTGLTINLAGSGTANTAEGSSLLGLKLGRAMKYPSNPVLNLGSGGTWDDAQIRELHIVIDEDGFNVVEPDGLWGYYGAYDGSVWKIGLAKSTDGGLSWTKYGGNPILSGAGSGWYQNGVLQPSVVKLNDGTYVMAAAGVDGSSVHSIGTLTSNDGLTWSDAGQKLVLADFAESGTAMTEIGVPNILKCADSTWRMLLECRKTGVANGWRIFGATASDPTSTWTPMNSGEPVFTPTGAGWESVGVANPTFIEVSSGNYLMAYNGINTAWQVGFASTSDFSAWTRNTDNPVISPDPLSGPWDDFYAETSHLIKDINSSHIRMFYQGYESGTTVRVGLALIPQGKVLNPKDTANTADGWVVGADLDALTTFVFESLVNNTDDVNNSSNVQIGLMDFAAVPSPTDNSTWNAAARFLVNRQSTSDTNKNQFNIVYQAGDGTFYFWSGATWVAWTPSYFYRDGMVKVVVWDDGTNYKVDLRDWEGNSLLANVASIAKASVKSFSSGRTLVLSEPFTNFYYNGMDFDNFIVRKFASDEPSVAVGDPE